MLVNPAFAAADFATPTNGNLALAATTSVYPKTFGINCLFFPKPGFGVAVGALASFGIATPGTLGYANIVMTIDQASSWMAVTGSPPVTSTAAVSSTATSAPYPVRPPATTRAAVPHRNHFRCMMDRVTPTQN